MEGPNSKAFGISSYEDNFWIRGDLPRNGLANPRLASAARAAYELGFFAAELPLTMDISGLHKFDDAVHLGSLQDAWNAILPLFKSTSDGSFQTGRFATIINVQDVPVETWDVTFSHPVREALFTSMSRPAVVGVQRLQVAAAAPMQALHRDHEVGDHLLYNLAFTLTGRRLQTRIAPRGCCTEEDTRPADSACFMFDAHLCHGGAANPTDRPEADRIFVLIADLAHADVRTMLAQSGTSYSGYAAEVKRAGGVSVAPFAMRRSPRSVT